MTTLGPNVSQMQTVQLASGAVTTLFPVGNRKGSLAALSLDGRQIAFSERIFGQMSYVISVANLDGSNRRVVVNPGNTPALTGVAWSPDGAWLLVTGQEYSSPLLPPVTSAFLVNPQTCQVVPLPAVDGQVSGWVR